MSDKSGTSSQAITLPSGGGALSGLGETFKPDLFTGTGNLTVPLGIPPGRNGFQPQLTLSYSTGNGNGPFGLGWALDVPTVRRQTAHGIPRYRDGSAADGDTFVLSDGAELVAVGDPRPGVTRFRPRAEAAFARIERDRSAGGDVWRVSAGDGLVATYGGGDDPSVVADPGDRRQIFAWALSEARDPFGNRIEYSYRHDTSASGARTWDQQYLERVRYVDYEGDGERRFLVSVAFVYAERPDPFTDHRAGFEIRTRLRCRRVEVRTHPDEGDVLCRTYALDYLDEMVAAGERPAAELPPNGVSLLSRIRTVGHDGDRSEALPPLDLSYTGFESERRRFQALEAVGNTLPPVSLAADDLDMVSLFGNGLPDIVQMNGSVRFWRNLGGGRFDRPQEMAEVPAGIRLGDPGVQFADMNGDGRADLLTLPQRGYFPLAFEGRWSAQGFVRYPAAPSVSLGTDDIRLIDLDGDGVVDALRTGPSFELFFNDPRAGWERVETRSRRPLAEFPDVTFADPRVKLADLDGDGLLDVVLVGQGRIDYWPYHGHGEWGRRVTMEASPVFRDDPPLPTGFDPRRVIFGDVDGDGLDDVVYVEAAAVTCWFNRGGGAWSDPIVIDRTPPFTDVDGVRLTDVLGTGMCGVLWSTDPVPGSGSHYRFLDPTGGRKPYLLERVDNHLGAVTTISYRPSTAAYLDDQGLPSMRWKAPLPMPVHVVARVQTVDEISGGTLTNEFTYHDGFWDGVDREFAGFGMVEQRDTEAVDGGGPAAANAPPILTKTWFHQGATGDDLEPLVENDRSAQFWPEDPPTLGHVEAINTVLEPLVQRVRRDALRSLRGRVLRTETYSPDDSILAPRPVSVTEHAYGLREEEHPGDGDDDRPRVFSAHATAERQTQWDRGSEPMTTFTFTDEHDAYGQARRSISIAVPRHRDFARRSANAEPYLGTVTATTFAQRDDGKRLIVDRVATSTTHEIHNDGSPSVFELRDAVRAGAAELVVSGQTISHYDGEPFSGLPVGQLGDFGAAVRTRSLVLTPELLREAYSTAGAPDEPPYFARDGGVPWTDDYPEPFRRATPRLAGYEFSPGESGHVRGFFAEVDRRRIDPGSGIVVEKLDPLGRTTTVAHDVYGLLPVRSTDSAGLTIEAEYDYRVLQARCSIDVNGNRTAYAYTPLGMLATVAVMGKEGEDVGDTTEVPGTTFAYDFTSAPVSVRTTRRAHHVNDVDVPPAEANDTLETVEFSDGFGRLVQVRTRAEDAIFGAAPFGGHTLPTDPSDPSTGDDVTGRRNDDARDPNVVVSGWQVFDNKGRVVVRHEPFFSTGWTFAAPHESELGRRVELAYDSSGRLVRTVGPDGSEERLVHGIPAALDDPDHFEPTPWEAYSYDANDNAGRTHPAEAVAYEHHWDTPSSTVIDALGRVTATTARDRAPRSRPDRPLPPVAEVASRTAYDIRGNVTARIDALGRQACAYVCDLDGRVLREEHIDGGTRRAVFDAAGAQIERRDSKGALTLQRFDVVGRLDRQWARDGAGESMTLRQRVEYGDGGTAEQPASARAESRRANRLGVIHRRFDEAGLTVLEHYDVTGNAVDQRCQVIADGRLLEHVGPGDDGWTAVPFRVDWEPDPGGTIDELAAELLDAVTDEISTRFDALGRPIAQTTPVGADGQRRVIRLGYDRAGALGHVALDDVPVVSRIAYDAKGQRTLVTYGNGVMTRLAYDPDSFELVRLRSERFESPDPLICRPLGAALQDLEYAYDVAGNITAITDRTPGSGVRANPDARRVDDAALRAALAAGDALVRRFAYDPLYRLVSATGRECAGADTSPPWADGPRCGFGSGGHGTPDQDNAPSMTAPYRQTYRYDAGDNLTRLGHNGGAGAAVRVFATAAGSNRLSTLSLGDSRIEYRHDGAGNLVQETNSRHFEWDHADRMKAFRIQAGDAEPSVHTQYLYASDGQRVKKLVRRQGGAIETTTYVAGVFERHHRRPPRGAGSASTIVHVGDGEQRVMEARHGEPHPDDRGPAVRYMLADHLGSVSVALDDSGSFVNREEWAPFGETTFGGFARKRYRFNGKERDEESGLYYFDARYYAPWTGRFTGCDPADPAETGSLNRYAGLGGNPVNLVDPDGRNPNKPKVTGPSKRQLVLDAILRTVFGGGGEEPKKAPEPPVELDRSGDDDPRDEREKSKREGEALKRDKNKQRPNGTTPPDDGPLPGRGPGSDSRRWLPSGKRGQRSARRTERGRFHPSEETTRSRRGLPPRTPRPKAASGSAPAAVGGGGKPPAGGDGGGSGRGGALGRGARRGAAGALVYGLGSWLVEGEPPSPGDVAVAAMPILAAEDHGDTVIPIILMFAGWKVTLVVAGGYAVYAYAEAVQEQPVLAVPPAAAGMGAPAHSLGARGGFGNLLCYPGKPGCGRRRR
jgi:RHS repeat-associated protein